MNEISQLINVKFEDKTNYINTQSNDTICIPFWYPWGPKTLEPFTYTEFLETYPPECVTSAASSEESVPMYLGYAKVLEAFRCGAGSVIAYNVNDEEPKKLYISRTWVLSTSPHLDGGDPQVPGSGQPIDSYILQLKYGGTPYGGILKTQLSREAGSDFEYSIKVSFGDKVEIYTGSLTPLVIGGESYKLCDVINRESTIFNCIETTVPFGTTTTGIQTPVQLQTLVAAIDIASMYYNAYTNVLCDYNVPATIYVSPFNGDTNYNDEPSWFYKTILTFCDSLKDRVLLMGYPTSGEYKEALFKTELTKLRGLVTNAYMGAFLCARVKVPVNGVDFETDGTAGWAARISNVASSTRINQLPSAFSYGYFPLSLTESSSFGDVLSLHDIGICSIFNSNEGPLIWGVRSIFNIQTSYFGQLNVVRVASNIIRNTYPIALQALHTQAAQDPIERASYQTRFQQILDSLIASRCIKSDSSVNLGGEINSDVNTKGGRIFNIVYTVYFIGVVEKINITIQATDSSVSADITTA